MTRLALLLLMASEFSPRTVTDPAGRYFGIRQAGQDPYGSQSLEFTLAKHATSAKLVWRRGGQDGELEHRDLKLVDLEVDARGLRATVTGDRPDGLPERLKGTFVTRFPPPEAKGPVTPGLLLDGGWFLGWRAP